MIRFNLRKPVALLLFFLTGMLTGYTQPRLVVDGGNIKPEQLASTENYKLWMETGDGNVVTKFNTGMLWTDNGQRLYPATMFAARLYDDRARPPRPPQTTASLAGRTESSFVAQNMVSIPLSADTAKKVKLFASVNEVVPGDPMAAGISFRIIGKGSYRLVFKYNSRGKTAFVPIDPRNNLSLSDNNDQPVIIPPVRTFNNESVRAAGANGTYNNSLVIQGISSEAGKIINLFLTLIPGGKIDSTEIEVAYYYNSSMETRDSWELKGTDILPAMAGNDSHDPNNIIVSPKSLPAATTKSTLHYTINFENTGPGDATTVLAAFFHPSEMDITQSIKNLQVMYSDKLWKADMIYDTARRCYIFTIQPPPGETLYGTDRVPDYPNHPKSKGKLEFDIEIKRVNGIEFPDLAEAYAQIYFTSLNDGAAGDVNNIQQRLIDMEICLPGTVGFELPVRTRNAYTLFTDACNGGQADCKCADPHGFWQWLCCRWWIIAIIILALAVFWLLYKLRRQNN